MKTILFLLLSHLSVVLAGGYQGCLERILLYNAYEIDGLNPEADQKIGFKCVSKPDEKAKTCDKWEACKPKKNSGRTRCNFDDLVFFLGKSPGPTGWTINGPDGKMDIEATATNCYKKYTSGGKKAKVPNFPPWVAMKDKWEFNDYIKSIGNTVNNAYKDKGNTGNKGLWDNFDATLAKVAESRSGDHGPFLVKEAKAKLGGKMEVKIQNVGSGKNPATGETWETVDWKGTAEAAKAKGVPDVDKEIQGFLKDFYAKTNKNARDHRVVMQSYKRVDDRSQSCR
ncbi:hypothetical protein ABKA04_004964 [Annulohypoxylon sp. FPYF3050]